MKYVSKSLIKHFMELVLPDLIRDILTSVLNTKINSGLFNDEIKTLFDEIRIQKYTQFEIASIHNRLRNKDKLFTVLSEYRFNFDYNVSLLEKIMKINIDPNNIDFISILGMCSYIAWEIIIEKTSTVPQTGILLQVLIPTIKSNNATIVSRVINQVFITYMSKDFDFKIYLLMPQFIEYSKYCFVPKLFICIIRHISKNQNDDRFKKFLVDIATVIDEHYSKDSQLFNDNFKFQIVQYLLNFISEIDYSALFFIKKALRVLSDECIKLIIPMLPNSIFNFLKKYDPIKVGHSQKEPDVITLTKIIKNELDFSDMETLPDGFDPSFTVTFPAIIELNQFFDKNTCKSLSSIATILSNTIIQKDDEYSPTTNTSINFFVECYFDFINKNMQDDHIYNFFCALLFICSKISRLFLTTTLAQSFFHPLIFNKKDTIFECNDVSNFNTLNTLRSISLDFVLSDYGNAIDEIIQTDIMKIPLFVAELFARLSNVSTLFAAKIDSNPKLIKTISSIILYYQHYEIAILELLQTSKNSLLEKQKKSIQLARISIFATLAHLFSDIKTLKTFYDDSIFINSISVFLFEEPIRPFVISSLTTYFSLVEIDIDYDFSVIFDHIIKNINIQLPNHRYILLLKDIMTILVTGLAYHQKGIERFSNTCKILCQSLARLSNDEDSYKTYEIGINLLALMSSYFEISNIEIEALISGLTSFKNPEFKESLYPKFLSLLAGQSVPPTSPNFIIKQPQVIKLIIQVYQTTDKLDKIITLISDLCSFSSKNLEICSESDLDLAILSLLEKMKVSSLICSSDGTLCEWQAPVVKKFLEFYTMISINHSKTQSVLRYVSLLSPIDNKNISPYQTQFIKALESIVMKAYEQPLSTFPLNGSKIYSDSRSSIKKSSKHLYFNDSLENGFALLFWVYIEPSMSDYRPRICTIDFNAHFRVGLFLSRNSLFLFQDENELELTTPICDNITEQKWHMISIHYQFTNVRTFIHYSIDCNINGITTIPTPSTQTLQEKVKCKIKIGGGFRSSKQKKMLTLPIHPHSASSAISDIEPSSKLALFALFNSRALEDFIQIYEIGIHDLCNLTTLPLDPVFFISNFSEYIDPDHKPNGFMDVLIGQCGVNCLIPLFLQTNMLMNGEPFTISFELIITLLNHILVYSVEAQKSFYQSKGFSIIAQLLTDHWTKYFTFKNYQQLYQLLLSIQYEPLQQQLFDEVLTNYTFLMNIDDDLHIRILRHWWQSLFPSFKLIAQNFSSFEDIASIMRLFYWYQPIETMKIKYINERSKSLNIEECRKYLASILFDYASESFELNMFECILSHCVSCAEQRQVTELIQLLIKIFKNLNEAVVFKVGNNKFLHFIHYFLQYPCEETRILVIKLLLTAYKSKLINVNFFQQQLDTIIINIPESAITENLYSFLVSELNNEPMLINICCFIGASLDSSKASNENNHCSHFLKDYFLNLNRESRSGILSCFNSNYSKLWAVGILYVALFVDKSLLDLIFNAFKGNLIDLLVQYDLFLPKNEQFELQLSNFILNHQIDIPDPFEICQRLIGFANDINHYSLFSQNDFNIFNRVRRFSQETNKTKIEIPIYSHKNIKDFVINLYSKPLYKPNIVFKLKINRETKKWEHEQLALVFLKKLEDNFMPSYLPFDLFLCSFLQTTEIDVFDHLCAIYLNDRDLSNCDAILPLLEYHTFVNHKRHYIQNQFFGNPFPSKQSYDNMINQIMPNSYISRLHKYYDDFTLYQQYVQNCAERMMKIDISLFIENASTQANQFIERQEFQNELNVQSWCRLWTALSSERAPWYFPSNSNDKFDKLDEWQRSATTCFSFAPIRMEKTYSLQQYNQQIKVQHNLFLNYGTSRGAIIDAKCTIVTVDGKYITTFYLFEKFMKIRIHNRRTFEISNDTITHVLLRKNHGIQIFSDTGFTFHLEFTENEKNISSDDIISKILTKFNSYNLSPSSNLSVNPIVQNSNDNKTLFKSLPYQNLWINGQISNYQYIIFLNILAGRSFNDLDNYPFMPYVLNDFSNLSMTNNDMENTESILYYDKVKFVNALHKFNYRDFTKDSNNTLNLITKEEVLTYLNPIEPFKSIYRKIKDNSDTEFFSVDDLLHFAQINKIELIPEFYSMPELFSSPNLALPMWSNTPCEFVYMHRKILESDAVSKNLDIWITKVFGSKSKNSYSNMTLFDGEHPKKNFFTSIPKSSKIQMITEFPVATIHGTVKSALIQEEKPYIFRFIFYHESGKMTSFLADVNPSNSPNALITTKPSTHQDSKEVKKTQNIVSLRRSSFTTIMGGLSSSGQRKNTNAQQAVSTPLEFEYNSLMTQKNLRFHSSSDIAKLTSPDNEIEAAAMLTKKLTQKGLLNPLSLKKQSNFHVIASTMISSNGRFDCFVVAEEEKIVVIEITKQKRINVDTNSQHLTTLASDGTWIVFGGRDNSVVSVIKNYKITQSIPLFRDSLTCVTVSQFFKIVVVGTSDGTLVICSAATGDLVRVLQLSKTNDITPQKLIITPSWGFIVAYCSEIIAGIIKYSFVIYSTNGLFIRKSDILSQVDFWTTYKSKSGFDYLIYANESGHIFATEVFTAKQSNVIFCCRAKVVAATFSDDETTLVVTTSDGRIIFIPCNVIIS